MIPDAEEAIRTPWEDPPAAGAAREIAPGVLWIRLPMPMALDHVNCFALEEEGGWALVDPGLDTPATRALWQALLAGPLGGRPVSRVVATHHHPDHIGLAGWFQARGATLETTRTAWLYARMLVLDRQALPPTEMIAYWRSAGMDADVLARRSVEQPYIFADKVHPLPLGYRRLAAGEEIRLGGRRWTIRCGDGHAPEHATLWSLDDDLVIGGDQLLPMISAHIGVHASEPEADPLGEWLASCARLARYAEARHIVLPGHKLPYTGLPLRLRQMQDSHQRALDRLRAHLAEPRTAVECFPALFRRQMDDEVYGLALTEAVAHLNHLYHRGETRRTRRADGAWLWSLA